jgi:potassium uptake Trk family protein
MTVGFLILAGNTSYPIFLRLILWSLFKLLPENDYFHEYRQTFRFLLDHPRRCYTTLFPSTHTWWLVGSLFVLNGIDWIAFEILNINNGSIYISPDAPKALNGLFQALAVRSGGFYVVPISNLRVGLLVLYVLMMYISVYPVTITIRNSNVYEERSLGIYADDPDVEEETTKGKSWVPIWLSAFGRPYQEGSRSYFVRQQLRGQLAHDLWWICLAVLFITITETQSFGRDPITFSVFNIVFETVSAYGCVGISTGAPGVNYSFCGEWHVLSKLILCAVMIRGRHRGLPVSIDRAVLLPGEYLEQAEEEDAAVRREIALERKNTKRRYSEDLSTSNGTATV